MCFELNAASPTAQQGQVRLQGAEDAVRRGRAKQDLLDDGLQAAQSTSVHPLPLLPRRLARAPPDLPSSPPLSSCPPPVRHRSLPELQRPAAEEVQPLAFLCARGE